MSVVSDVQIGLGFARFANAVINSKSSFDARRGKYPPPSSTGLAFTNIKSYSDAGGVKPSEKENVKAPVGYFASPFKRFSKFQGTPTPSQFPLRSSNVGHKYVEEGASWYQQGDRWGQRTRRDGKQYYNPGQDQV